MLEKVDHVPVRLKLLLKDTEYCFFHLTISCNLNYSLYNSLYSYIIFKFMIYDLIVKHELDIEFVLIPGIKVRNYILHISIAEVE